MRRYLWLVLFLVLGYAAPASAQDMAPAGATPIAAIERCEGLLGGGFHDLPGAPTEIVKATFHAASGTKRAFCEISGYVNPTVKFGMYMPVENWNGRYIFRGCGGSCGDVYVEAACAGHLRDGYACITTDMGHYSTQVDNNWTANNLQGLVDFGYRATHVTTVAGKAITEAYYGRKPLKSYFMACSTGGRQGMVEVERFPTDFDGVIVVAPAAMGPLGRGYPGSSIATMPFNTDANGQQILHNRKVLLVRRAALGACDMTDGVKDGVVGDPRLCKFDPAVLECKANATDTSECLTAPELAVMQEVYRTRGIQPGAEYNWIGNYIRNAPYGSAKPMAVTPQTRGDRTIVDTLDNPGNPDLRAFKANGGKLIMAHGWNDQSVPPLPDIEYYDLVTRLFGGPENTRDFARLFMVPGMDHCSGGDGAWSIDYLAALETWVEGNQAPDKLMAYHPKADAPIDFFSVDLKLLDKAKWVEFSRPIYAYPKRAVYKGSGNPNDAASFVAK